MRGAFLSPGQILGQASFSLVVLCFLLIVALMVFIDCHRNLVLLKVTHMSRLCKMVCTLLPTPAFVLVKQSYVRFLRSLSRSQWVGADVQHSDRQVLRVSMGEHKLEGTERATPRRSQRLPNGKQVPVSLVLQRKLFILTSLDYGTMQQRHPQPPPPGKLANDARCRPIPVGVGYTDNAGETSRSPPLLVVERP